MSNIGEGAATQTPADAIEGLDADIDATQANNFIGTSTSYTESIGIDDNLTSDILQDFVDKAKMVADNSLMLADLPASGDITGSTSGANISDYH